MSVQFFCIGVSPTVPSAIAPSRGGRGPPVAPTPSRAGSLANTPHAFEGQHDRDLTRQVPRPALAFLVGTLGRSVHTSPGGRQ